MNARKDVSFLSDIKAMRYYPVNLDIKDRNCLVVGGGAVGRRKVLTLMDCGANVTVVSPEVDKKLLTLAGAGLITIKKRPYQASDLDGVFLVIGATNNEALNFQIKEDADRQNRLCNIVDRPGACNFILPSVVNRGDLIIAISTSGKSPAFAKRLREDLEKVYGPEYTAFLRLMGAIRGRLLKKEHSPDAHRRIFEALIEKNLLELVKRKDADKINTLLSGIIGSDYTFESLMDSAP